MEPQKEIKRHPFSVAWDKWTESHEGIKCLAGTTSGAYLKNRLWAAFMAGAEVGSEVAATLDSPERETETQKVG